MVDYSSYNIITYINEKEKEKKKKGNKKEKYRINYLMPSNIITVVLLLSNFFMEGKYF